MTKYRSMSEAQIEAHREKSRLWGQQNKERVKARHAERREAIRAKEREWRQANRDRVRLNREKIRTADPEAWKARQRLYRQRCRAQRTAAEHARRSRKFGASGFHSESLWLARVCFFGWRCRYCKTALNPTTLSRDHMIPLCRGGSNWPSNLVPCCRLCNSRKRHRTFKEFAKGQYWANEGSRFQAFEVRGNGNA